MTPHFNKIYIVMGVSGAGKTSIATNLSKKLSAIYIEADEFHSTKNIETMRQGTPLTDELRLPWLRNLSQALLHQREKEPQKDVIVACSALKRKYRNLIRNYVADVCFIYLNVSFLEVSKRLSTRKGHFMPKHLLDSQFMDLEEPDKQERHIKIEANESCEHVVQQALTLLTRKESSQMRSFS